MPRLPVSLVALALALVSGASAGSAGTALGRSPAVKVGPGAGVPAVDRNAIWVPTTRDGSVTRVNVATRKVAARIKLGAPPRYQGYLDSAVVAGGSVWVARDVGDEVVRIDPKTNRISQRIEVEGRPGGMAVGGGYVWVFHFETGVVTRIDPEAGTKKVFDVPNAFGTGIAYLDGAVWLLSVQPAALFKLDPLTGKTLARVSVVPKRPAQHGIVDTWWVAAGAGSVWAVNANYDLVTRVDVATAKVTASVPVPVEIPFGVAVWKGAVWVAGEGKVVRVDPATNRVTGVVTLSKRSLPVFTQVATGPAGLWATDYEEGTLYRIQTA